MWRPCCILDSSTVRDCFCKHIEANLCHIKAFRVVDRVSTFCTKPTVDVTFVFPHLSNMQCSVDRVASSRACSSSTKTVVAMGCLAVARAPCSGRGCGRHKSNSRHVLSVASAYAPSLPSPGSQAARTSLDPMAADWEQAWEAGRLLTVKSPEQFSELQQQVRWGAVVSQCCLAASTSGCTYGCAGRSCLPDRRCR